MYYKRVIDNHLNEWIRDPSRKPLLLRGARQVGKSSAIRQLASQFVGPAGFGGGSVNFVLFWPIEIETL